MRIAVRFVAQEKIHQRTNAKTITFGHRQSTGRNRQGRCQINIDTDSRPIVGSSGLHIADRMRLQLDFTRRNLFGFHVAPRRTAQIADI